MQKIQLTRLKLPTSAKEETWVTDQDGDPVFLVVAEPSGSLAGELRLLRPDLRVVVGRSGRATVCFDRAAGPTLFADIIAAGSGLLTWSRPRPRGARNRVHDHYVRR